MFWTNWWSKKARGGWKYHKYHKIIENIKCFDYDEEKKQEDKNIRGNIGKF